MARIPTQNKYPDRAGYLALNTDTNEVEVFSDGTFKSAVNKVFSAVPEGYVNVKDFGAKGDGITDDTIAIQNAINSAQPGQTVFFPNGKYVIENVTLRFYVSLKGISQVDTMDSTMPSSTLVGKNPLVSNGLIFSSVVQYMSISNLTFTDFNKAITTQDSGLVQYVKFRDLSFIHNLVGMNLNRSSNFFIENIYACSQVWQDLAPGGPPYDFPVPNSQAFNISKSHDFMINMAILENFDLPTINLSGCYGYKLSNIEFNIENIALKIINQSYQNALDRGASLISNISADQFAENAILIDNVTIPVILSNFYFTDIANSAVSIKNSSNIILTNGEITYSEIPINLDNAQNIQINNINFVRNPRSTNYIINNINGTDYVIFTNNFHKNLFTSIFSNTPPTNVVNTNNL